MSNIYAGIPFGNPFMHHSNPYVNLSQIVFTNTNPSFSPATSLINTQQQQIIASSSAKE